MKRYITKCMALCAILTASMVIAVSAHATCFQSGELVERVLVYNDINSSGNTYVYLRPRTALTNSTYYYCRIPPNEPAAERLVSAATAAKTTRTEVNVLGDASSCPTSGTARFMGNCYYIYLLN